MKQGHNWELKAEEALESLNGIQRASANPFLYTRIRATLAEHQNKWSRIANFIGRPVIVFSVTGLFIGLNAWAIMHYPVNNTVAKHAPDKEPFFDQDYATVDYSFLDTNNPDK